MDKALDVLAYGAALVDISQQVSEEDFAAINKAVPMTRGTFNLVDARTSDTLLSFLKTPSENSGGSTANTMIGLASFGGRAGFVGRTGQDRFGDIYENDLRANNVQPELARMTDIPSGRCVILITPDGERTMNTYRGASQDIEDIRESLIPNAKALLMEGYMLDSPSYKQAFQQAAKIAYSHQVKVGLSLSSEFTVHNHRDDMIALAHKKHGIVFANKNESIAFAQTKTFEEAVPVVASLFETAALTYGSKGAVIVYKDKITEIPIEPIQTLVDTTGAGDQFAAGFLYGYTQGMPLEKCGQLGAMAAAEVIQHLGPRPQIPYSSFIRKLG